MVRAGDGNGGRGRGRGGALGLHFLLANDFGPEDGILTGHAPCKGAVELGSQSELAHVVGLLGVEGISLLHEALVLEALEAFVPGLDLLGLWVASRRRGFREV